MTSAPDLAEGMATAYARAVPLVECSALADPALLDQHRALNAFPALSAKWRELSWGERFGNEAPALPVYNGRSVGSPQMVPQATLDAAGDLDRDVRARLADGRLRVIGYQEPRRLDADPILLPSALAAAATVVNWRAGKIRTGGMTFIECRVLQDTDLAAAEPEPEPEVDPPPATLAKLVEVLEGLFLEDPAWSKAGDARLAELVAARDPRFKPHEGPPQRGRWSRATTEQRVRETRAEAKSLASRGNY